MLAVVTALAIGAALARDGLARRMKSLVPRTQRVGGAMLILAAVYLTYYWARALWGPVEALAQDPIVGQVQRLTTGLERFAAGRHMAGRRRRGGGPGVDVRCSPEPAKSTDRREGAGRLIARCGRADGASWS